MDSKSIHRLFIYFLAMSILLNIISSPIYCILPKTLDNEIFLSVNKDNNKKPVSTIINHLPMVVFQDNTTDITNTTTSITTDDTESTTGESGPGSWKPLIDDNLYYPLALIFSLLGVLSAIWLIFFVETSKDRTIRERLIGSTIRLILMGIFLGLAVHFWVLFEPI